MNQIVLTFKTISGAVKIGVRVFSLFWGAEYDTPYSEYVELRHVEIPRHDDNSGLGLPKKLLGMNRWHTF